MQCPFCREEINDGALKCKHCGAFVPQAGGAAAAATPDFGGMFSAAMNTWKENLADLAVMTLVFMLVAWIPIANIGFIAGYARSVMKVARGQGKAKVGDIFGAWDCFGNLLVYMILFFIAAIVLAFIPIIGSIAGIALGFLAAPGMLLIIDRNTGAVDAFKWGIATIQEDVGGWALAYVVSYVIMMAGFIVLLVGAILSIPLGQLLLIRQYDKMKPA